MSFLQPASRKRSTEAGGSIVPIAVLFTLACLLGNAWAQSPPSAITVSEFINAQTTYPESHASTIVETSSGVLIAAWFGGTEEGNSDVGIWLARRLNDRWSQAVEVATGVQPDGRTYPTWNPVLFQSPKGPLFLFYKVGPSPAKWWGMQMTSADGGATWSKPTRLPEGILGPIKNKPVILPGGNWLSGSSSEQSPTNWRVHFELSRNQGSSWETIGPVDRGAGFDAIQPTILFTRPGRLEALCRTRQGVVAMTWSSDGGRTWMPLAATELPNPNSGIDAVTLRDGRLLLAYNHAAHLPEDSGWGNRYPLDVAISNDGLKWKRVLTLEDEPRPAGYAYPAVVQTADGLVHITYTWGRKRIKHVVIDPQKLDKRPHE